VRRVSGTHEASLIKPNKSQDELENCWSDSQCPTEIQKKNNNKALSSLSTTKTSITTSINLKSCLQSDKNLILSICTCK
jgi:hypothetical protein